MTHERGQAAVEFVALVLLGCLVLGALVAFAPAADGRAVGGFLMHHLSCAVSGRCNAAEQELSRAIIEATVDEADFTGGRTRLVKYLNETG